jgi:small subunit ribosomal protein S4e
MVKQHLKALYAPKTWDIKRKETTFVTRPKPGAHSFRLGTSINHILKKELNIASTSKESKTLLNRKSCLVNGKVIGDVHYIVGFMDVVSFPEIKKNYRVTLSKKGKLSLIEIDEKEVDLHLSKIIGKKILTGKKVQINTMDARNILVKENMYKTSDSLLIELSSKLVKKHLSFKESNTIMLIGGKHIGSVGQIEKIEDKNIFFKNDSDGQVYETLKKFAFVLGEKKSEIKVQ